MDSAWNTFFLRDSCSPATCRRINQGKGDERVSSSSGTEDRRVVDRGSCFARVVRPVRMSYKNQSKLLDLFEQRPSCCCEVCIHLKYLHDGMTKEETATVFESETNPVSKTEPNAKENLRLNEQQNANTTNTRRNEVFCSLEHGQNRECRSQRNTVPMKGCDGTGSSQNHGRTWISGQRPGHENSQSERREADSPPEERKRKKCWTVDQVYRREESERKQKVRTAQDVHGESDSRPWTPDEVFSPLQQSEDKTTTPDQSPLVSPKKTKRVKRTTRTPDSRAHTTTRTSDGSPRCQSVRNAPSSSSPGSTSTEGKSSLTGSALESHPTDCHRCCSPPSPKRRGAATRHSGSTPTSQFSDCNSASSPSGSSSDSLRDQNPASSSSPSVSSGSSSEQHSRTAGRASRGGSEFSFLPWREGHVMWGRLTGHPWWPCLVCDDAEGHYVRVKAQRDRVLTEYHVQYFGKAREQSWLRCTSLKKFEGKAHMLSWARDELKKVKCQKISNTQRSENLRKLKERFGPFLDQTRDKFSKRDSDCLSAVQQAEEAKKLTRRERLNKYVRKTKNVKKTECRSCLQSTTPTPQLLCSLGGPVNPVTCNTEPTEDQASPGPDVGDHVPAVSQHGCDDAASTSYSSVSEETSIGDLVCQRDC